MSRVGESAPLEGVRVLDLGRFRAAPACGLMLSRLGADVLKVEPPWGEDTRHTNPSFQGQSVYWVQYNSGKRSLGVDLYSEKGKEILRRLVAVSDIFIQNFRPGTIDSMGFGYQALKSLNPRIVMVNVSAYGQYGPYWERPGFDRTVSALSGFMYSPGEEGMPPMVVRETVIDQMTGLTAATGALAALREAERTGEGQSLDIALADLAYTAMAIPITYHKLTGIVEKRSGLGRGFSAAHKCKDGMIYVMGAQLHFRQLLSELIGHPEWIEEEGIAHRNDPEAVAVQEEELGKWFGQQTMAEAATIISALGIPVSPLHTVAQAAEDPHPWARDVLVEVPDPISGKIYVPGNPMHYSRSGYNIGPAPLPGEHTQEILREILGMTEEDLRQLKEEKAI